MRRAASIGAAGAALCALAALFAATALYVPGIALLLVATLAPAWVSLGAFGASLELEPTRWAPHQGWDR